MAVTRELALFAGLVGKPREYWVVTYGRTDAVDATTPAPPRWARFAAHV